MNLNTMTTNERERLAYAEGFVETAKLFARLDDMQRALGADVADYEELQTQRDDLESERDALFDDYQTMRAERDELRVALRLAIGLLQDGEQMRALDTMRAVVW